MPWLSIRRTGTERRLINLDHVVHIQVRLDRDNTYRIVANGPDYDSEQIPEQWEVLRGLTEDQVQDAMDRLAMGLAQGRIDFAPDNDEVELLLG